MRLVQHGGGRLGIRIGATAIAATAMVVALTGCSLLTERHPPRATHSAAALGSVSPTDSTSGAAASVTPTPEPTATAAPDPAESHLATAAPQATPSPAPTITAIPAGTVVAQGSVVSPKGSIRFSYRMVTNEDGTYTAEYSGFTSTVPVPISATLIDIPPGVGDGLTYRGVGDHQLGGPTTAAAAPSSAALGTTQPGYLTTLVTYSSATSDAGLPVELGPEKVLAVTTLHWSIPVRQTNVHPVDGGAREFAKGQVAERTSTGAPKHYVVASGDTTAMVATRFGISVEDLIWLNAGLEVFGDQQYLYSGTTINLDPQSR